MNYQEVFFYTLTAFLVFVGTLQRSKNEEELREGNILLLPVFTVVGMIVIYFLIEYVRNDLVNALLLVFFVITGYWTLVSNSFFFIELTYYEYQEIMYDNELSDSEFSEILVDGKQNHRVKKKKSGCIRFFKSCYYAVKKAIVNITFLDFCVYFLAALIVATYALTKDEFISEIVSISICFQTIREVKIYSVFNGYTVLIVYFMYDIVKIYFSDQIEILNSSIDVPIKLVLPISLHAFEMVGFGDLFIPAFFIAICKKYGEQKNCISFWYVTYASFCIGIVLQYLSK